MSKYLLNGNWQYVKNEKAKLNYRSVSKLFTKQFNDIKLPINWELAGFNNYSGVVWFRREFKVNQKRKNEAISIIKFLGVDYFADVWLNGKYLGNHEGYFQSFNFDVTEILNYNSINEIIVKVNSPYEEPKTVWPLKKQLIKGIFNHHDCRPGSWSYEFGQDKNTGGIWNDIELYVNEKIIIENTKITTLLSDDHKSAKVKIEVKYSSNLLEAKETKINLTAVDSKNKKTNFSASKIIESGISNLILMFEIKNPKLWWSWDLGEPNLYSLNIDIKGFTKIKETFGIREIKIDKNDRFYLNSRELFLRGTNIIPTQFLSELNSTRIKKIVDLIREANINIVRVHAHVNRKELYEEFDKQGIMLWQDFSLQWTYEESEKFSANAVSQIKDMVNGLYNHASIAFWCCHNEPGEQIKTLDPFLYDAVLSEDQSRIIRLASNYEEHPYDGWYWGDKEHFAATPMGPLVTEFGAQGIPNKKSLEKFIPKNKMFPPNIKHWEYHDFQPNTTFNIAKIELGDNIEEFIENSQKYQSELISTAIHFYRRKKNQSITGIFQFMFVDCWPSITWAVVDYYLEKKKGFQTLKECYAPLLLSVNFRQNQYFPNGKLNFDFHIINDTYSEYDKLILKVKVDGKEIGKVQNLSVGKNSVSFRHFESLDISLPSNLELGKHKIDFQLFNKRTMISSNNFKLNIIKV